MADTPDRPTLRHLISARLFGGASGGVFRGMATLALGSGIGRVIGIAAIPVLTRLYSPEDFGVLAVFAAFVQILIPLATLRYLVALPLPRSDRVAFALIVLCLGLAFVLSAVVGAVLFAFGTPLFGLFSMEILVPFWWLLAIGMLGASIYETLTMWATRKRQYRVIAQTQIVQSAVGEGLKVLLALLAFKPLGLLVGQVAGHSGGVGRLLLTFRNDFVMLKHRFRWRDLRLVARRYRGFPTYRLPAQFLLVFSMQAPLLFAAYLYDAETTGQFGLAMMAVSLPFSLLGQATSRAFYGEISKKKPEELKQITKQTMIRSVALVAPVALCLHLFGISIFEWTFGEQWRLAGTLASILAIFLVPQFAAAPLLELFNFTSSQIVFLTLYVVRAILVASSALIAIYFGLGAAEFVTVYSVGLSVYYLIVIILIFLKLNQHEASKL